ncbi:MAG: T9SS type A sorting domain-containing protein [Bacteroidales bacterium]|nr:T9SS type A sorting domain-containing protein [Bacteroidales bacterium]
MRYLFAFTLFFSIAVCAYSQTSDFGANGFKWYYTYNTFDPDYVSYSYIVFDRDITVDGIEARVLCEYVPDNLNRYSLKSENIVYSQDSKVYRYSEDLQRFCLLYDFGKTAGESWQLDEYGVRMLVDSVAQMEIGGELRNVQYAHCSDTALYDSFGNRGIVDGIGSLKCLFPNQVKSYTDGLRCISDTAGLSYHFADMPDCDFQTGPRYYKSIFGKEKTEWWVGYETVGGTSDIDEVFTMPHDSFPCQDHTLGPCYRNDPVYALRSDTVLINEKSYQKIFMPMMPFYSDFYFREDTATGDVFRYNEYDMEEQLVFTMSHEVGDTFVYSQPYCYDLKYVVDSITFYHGRKILHLTNNTHEWAEYGAGFEHYDRVVEGFGPSYGIFGNMDPSHFLPTSCILFDDTLVYSLYPECGCNPVNCDIVHKNSEWITPSDIYPNPACDVVNVDIPETISGKYNIKVFSMLGTVLFDDNSSDSTYRINISQFPEGMYTIVVYYMGVYHVGKFVKI